MSLMVNACECLHLLTGRKAVDAVRSPWWDGQWIQAVSGSVYSSPYAGTTAAVFSFLLQTWHPANTHTQRELCFAAGHFNRQPAGRIRAVRDQWKRKVQKTMFSYLVLYLMFQMVTWTDYWFDAFRHVFCVCLYRSNNRFVVEHWKITFVLCSPAQI